MVREISGNMQIDKIQETKTKNYKHSTGYVALKQKKKNKKK